MKQNYKYEFSDYKNLDKRGQREFCKQFEPLVNKITKQFVSKVHIEWERVSSMAWEGFSIALQKYNPDKSTMNFVQYAGFSIRNNILTSLDNELRIVKLSAYAQGKIEEMYGSKGLFNTISMDAPAFTNDKNDNETSTGERPNHKNMFDRPVQEQFSDGNIFDYIYQRIESQFSERDCDMFYKSFGLKEFEETKGKDIAKEYGVSEGLVSQKIKRIIKYIRKDNDMCEMLAHLLDQ